MKFEEMTPREQDAYNFGATRWGIGVAFVMIVSATTWLVLRGLNEEPGASGLSFAQASEPDRIDLFALNAPANACQNGDDIIAWHRDDSFATQLRVWCVERSDGAEGDSVVAWSQAENQRFATRRVVDSEFYSHKVLLDGEDKKPYVDACGGDGFLGWSRSGMPHSVNGVTTRQDGDKIKITGFYGGNLWCLGDDLYTLRDALDRDDNRPDHRIDIAKDVETDWTL